MKRFLRYVLLPVSLSLMVASCSVYHPQSVDIPLIEHVGDVRLDASLGTSWWLTPDAVTLNATGTVGITDKFAGQLHVNYGGDSYYLQAAPGFYLPFAQVLVFETYAGLGYGGGSRSLIDHKNSDNAVSDYAFDGTYFLPFAQANLGVTAWAVMHLDIAVALKAGLFLPDFTYFDVDGSEHEIPGTRQTYDKANFLLEPQVMVRWGGSLFRTNVKVGFCWMSDLSKYETNFVYDYLTASVGLTFCF